MPIEGLSERKQLPRLGKLRLGIKKLSQKTGREYPVATNYFVCPQEVVHVYGSEPKQIDVIIPVEDEEIWASQYYRQYSRTRGLVCKGDGKTCRRMIDTESGDIAGRETKEIIWREGVTCVGRDCPDYKAKACQEVMNLQVILPKVPGLGIYQIDTGSIHSIMNINNSATMIRAMIGRVSWVPLVLTLEPTEVNNPDDGKKKTVHCMQLRYERSVVDLLTDSQKPRLQMLLGKPVEDEAPEDRLLGTGTPEKAEEHEAKVQDDIAQCWPQPDDEPRMNKRDIMTFEVEGIKLPAVPRDTMQSKPAEKPPETQPEGKSGDCGVDMEWLRENCKKIKWSDAVCMSWIEASFKVKRAETLEKTIALLDKEQKAKLCDFVAQAAGK